jgi:hypothetical protein
MASPIQMLRLSDFTGNAGPTRPPTPASNGAGHRPHFLGTDNLPPEGTAWMTTGTVEAARRSSSAREKRKTVLFEHLRRSPAIRLSRPWPEPTPIPVHVAGHIPRDNFFPIE